MATMDTVTDAQPTGLQQPKRARFADATPTTVPAAAAKRSPVGRAKLSAEVTVVSLSPALQSMAMHWGRALTILAT
jgi:hypothetical protein